MAYLLDANVFIQAEKLHYGLDFCPAFWEWLVNENAAGRVVSIEKVSDEIEAGALQVADYYLVSQVLADNHTVVTHEIPSTSRKRIKITDACLGVSVKFVTPFEMLRTSKARFVLPTP